MPKKILVIEDEKDIQELLQLYLKRDGYDVHIAKDGETGLRRASQERYDLILLDLMLPQLDGLEVCRTLRSRPQTADIPIIMITAKAEESDRIVGLEIGADDYITKPFSPREVLARVKALFRRMEKPKTKEVRHEYGGIALDHSRHEVTYKGKSHSLTTKEFNLLEYFLANKGRVLSRDILLNEIWGYDYFGTTRTVDVHVAHLRHKFQVLNKSLVAIKGLGYKLQDEPVKT
ncbi:MAG TPA: response regulator transcription factor [Thermodesulfobacteriota bacterium]|nr:response regulator transcription factor [Thermodesulfobacteriota bacterium]